MSGAEEEEQGSEEDEEETVRLLLFNTLTFGHWFKTDSKMTENFWKPWKSSGSLLSNVLSESALQTV